MNKIDNNMAKHLCTQQVTVGHRTWNITTLIVAAKGLTPFDVPINLLDRSSAPFTIRDFSEYVNHYKLVESADLKEPIILSASGVLLDGNHRVCKALLKGNKTIKAVQFDEDPQPDSIDEE